MNSRSYLFVLLIVGFVIAAHATVTQLKQDPSAAIGIQAITLESGDSKPADALPGSIVLEVDTGKTYRWDDAAASWIQFGDGVSLMTLLAGEDQTNDVLRVEGQFAYVGNIEADTQISDAPGFVHTITCSGSDAAVTQGTIILYDNTAESGTVIWEWNTQVVNTMLPFTVTLDAVATVGLYLGYTTVADVNCTVTYR